LGKTKCRERNSRRKFGEKSQKKKKHGKREIAGEKMTWKENLGKYLFE
jgi:hypothetical protein